MWELRGKNIGVCFRPHLAMGVLLVVAAGCQESASTVAGVVTRDGKPMSVPADSRGTIVFQPADGHGTTSSGVLDSTGHFKLSTGASLEVAPGKYQVAVSVVQLLPASDQAEQGGKRITPAKYASANTSTLEAKVIPGANECDFNLLSSADEGASDSTKSTP
jgi:hypothetical protein